LRGLFRGNRNLEAGTGLKEESSNALAIQTNYEQTCKVIWPQEAAVSEYHGDGCGFE